MVFSVGTNLLSWKVNMPTILLTSITALASVVVIIKLCKKLELLIAYQHANYYALHSNQDNEGQQLLNLNRAEP